MFTVHEIVWSESGSLLRRLPKTTRVAAFADPDEATADRWRREVAARNGRNPFRYGGASLFYQTTLPGPVLRDWYLDHDFEPPPAESADDHAKWREWWKVVVPQLPPDRVAVAWEPLDRVRFFEVHRPTTAGKAFVIVEINWTWNDNPCLDADAEGGKPVSAFRSRENAEWYCEELNRERRADTGFGRYDAFAYQDRRGGEYHRVPRETADFYEVIEIDLEETP